MNERTQVGIVGAGPAGLVLGQLLHLRGIESVVLEARSREYVEQRVRAGVLEQGTVDLMKEMGVGERMERQGLVHHGVELRFAERGHRIDFEDLTGGRAITVYGQQEVVKDLIAARLDFGGPLLFEVDDVRPEGIETDSPSLRYRHEGEEHTLDCDVIAGCDGFHGVCRDAVPAGVLDASTSASGRSPGSGILAEAAPSQRGADLRPPRARLRPAEHALADRSPASTSSATAVRRARALARRAHLGGAAGCGSPAATSGSTRARSSSAASRRCAAS